ncbi:PIG-X [Mycena leptocephala]|nr:PIG-X [Mycena leptocephala]
MQSSSILHSQSFHPIFKTTISAPGFPNCSLHLHYALPSIVFVDPYELSNRADAYSFEYAGPSNLELPVFALGAEDEEADAGLLVSVTQRLHDDGALDVEVPLHVRYGQTAANGSPFQLTQVPWPDAFLACPAYHLHLHPHLHLVTSMLPPMRRSFASAFDGVPIVRLMPPQGAVPVETIRTPVGAAADVARVELGTAVVILAAFFYLVRAARRTAARLGTPSIVVPAKEE